MMIGTFYIMNNDFRDIPKTLDNIIGQYELIIKDDCDIHNPILELPYTTELFNSNYIHIDIFNKYYFINKKVVSPAGKMIIYCHHDVLQNYADSILNSMQLVSRQENNVNKYQPDNMIPLSVEKNLYLIPFSDNELNINSANAESMNFILTVSGVDVIDPTETEVK